MCAKYVMKLTVMFLSILRLCGQYACFRDNLFFDIQQIYYTPQD